MLSNMPRNSRSKNKKGSEEKPRDDTSDECDIGGEDNKESPKQETDPALLTEVSRSETETKKTEEKISSSSYVPRPTSTTDQPPISMKVMINPLWWILCILSLVTRLWRLSEPSQVVFDEVHFGKFISYYMHGIFFFDVHPPLGKQLLSLMAWLTNYEGFFPFQTIGEEYDSKLVAHTYLRLLPAVLGSAVPLMMYRIVTELGCSHYSAFLAALFLVFDNALVTQCRFILLDSILIFFIVLVVLCYVVFSNERQHFSRPWYRKLCLTGVALGCVLSVKFVGVFVVFLVGLHTLHDIWLLLGQRETTDYDLFRHFGARVVGLVFIPVVVFVTCFFIDFKLLYRSGPHDAFMSREFQSSLEGSRILTHPEEMPQMGVEYQIAYGTHVTLKRVDGETCWLHSHPHNYPVFYEDRRGSSAQQQITCYRFSDLNNWWVIQRPGSENATLDDPPVAVKDKDLVHLVHRMTGRKLNSHNVAAPLTPTNQEVSGYIHYENVSVLQDLWQVQFLKHPKGTKGWTSTSTTVQFVHINSSQALRTTDLILPEWGFFQFEVTTNTLSPKEGSQFIVEEIQFGINPQNRKETKGEAGVPISMWFFLKMKEMLYTMLVKNREMTDEHTFSSRPLEWPLCQRSIAYWISNISMAQIQLLGNPLLWWMSSVGVVTYFGLLGLYLIRRRRQIYDIEMKVWTQFKDAGWLLVGGWMIHYVPFFAMDRALFLHHYLPAAVFQIVLNAFIIDHVYHHVIPLGVRLRYTFLTFIGFLVLAVLWSFYVFSPFSYGLQSLTPESVASRRWLSTWDFLVRRPDGQIGMLI